MNAFVGARIARKSIYGSVKVMGFTAPATCKNGSAMASHTSQAKLTVATVDNASEILRIKWQVYFILVPYI
jgi:hypothetical protein